MIEISDEHPTEYLDMPEGLSGYWWETENQVCIPVVASGNPKAFISFLNKIESKGKTIFFPTLVNARLDKLLRLRGYQEAYVNDELMGFVDGLAQIP